MPPIPPISRSEPTHLSPELPLTSGDAGIAQLRGVRNLEDLLAVARNFVPHDLQQSAPPHLPEGILESMEFVQEHLNEEQMTAFFTRVQEGSEGLVTIADSIRSAQAIANTSRDLLHGASTTAMLLGMVGCWALVAMVVCHLSGVLAAAIAYPVGVASCVLTSIPATAQQLRRYLQEKERANASKKWFKSVEDFGERFQQALDQALAAGFIDEPYYNCVGQFFKIWLERPMNDKLNVQRLQHANDLINGAQKHPQLWRTLSHLVAGKEWMNLESATLVMAHMRVWMDVVNKGEDVHAQLEAARPLMVFAKLQEIFERHEPYMSRADDLATKVTELNGWYLPPSTESRLCTLCSAVEASLVAQGKTSFFPYVLGGRPTLWETPRLVQDISTRVASTLQAPVEEVRDFLLDKQPVCSFLAKHVYTSTDRRVRPEGVPAPYKLTAQETRKLREYFEAADGAATANTVPEAGMRRSPTHTPASRPAYAESLADFHASRSPSPSHVVISIQGSGAATSNPQIPSPSRGTSPV